jgi:hypothetical protein
VNATEGTLALALKLGQLTSIGRTETDQLWHAAGGRDILLEVVDLLLGGGRGPTRTEVAAAQVVLLTLRIRSQMLTGVSGLHLVD